MTTKKMFPVTNQNRAAIALAAVLTAGIGALWSASPAAATEEPPKDYGYNLTLWHEDTPDVHFPQTLVTNIDQPVPDINALDAAAQEFTDATGTRQCFQADLYKDDEITAALHSVAHLYGAENPDESWPGDGTYKSEYSKVWCLEPTPPVVVPPVEPPVVVPPVVTPPADLPPALPVTGFSDWAPFAAVGALLAVLAGLILWAFFGTWSANHKARHRADKVQK